MSAPPRPAPAHRAPAASAPSGNAPKRPPKRVYRDDSEDDDDMDDYHEGGRRSRPSAKRPHTSGRMQDTGEVIARVRAPKPFKTLPRTHARARGRRRRGVFARVRTCPAQSAAAPD